MANGNGTTVWKVLGSVALVLTVVSGSWALSSTVGPKQKLEDHERRLSHTESICEDYQMFQARQDEAMKAVNEKRDRLLRAAGL